jgi:hypothetical protein
MLRAAAAVTVAAACLAAPARGQGPRLRTIERVAPPQLPWLASTRSPNVGASQLTWRTDSTTIPRTYWLEGGLIGAVVLGFLGSGLCRLGDNPSVGCYFVVFFYVGGGIGFPAGALIGGLFPKG